MKLPLASPALGFLSTPVFAVVNIDWVDAGHAGNTADSTGYGAVAYAYKIGQYEVTKAQYTEFLNAVAPAGATSTASTIPAWAATLVAASCSMPERPTARNTPSAPARVTSR